MDKPWYDKKAEQGNWWVLRRGIVPEWGEHDATGFREFTLIDKYTPIRWGQALKSEREQAPMTKEEAEAMAKLLNASRIEV